MILALVAIVIALALTALVGQAFELSVFVVNMLTGMGLALGIDYALFIVSRYREERNGGRSEIDSITLTGATASRAVLFSGTAFVLAMIGMLLVPDTILRSLALGAILVGIVSVLAALTLLPAILGMLGDAVNALRIPWLGGGSSGAPAPRGALGRGSCERRCAHRSRARPCPSPSSSPWRSRSWTSRRGSRDPHAVGPVPLEAGIPRPRGVVRRRDGGRRPGRGRGRRRLAELRGRSRGSRTQCADRQFRNVEVDVADERPGGDRRGARGRRQPRLTRARLGRGSPRGGGPEALGALDAVALVTGETAETIDYRELTSRWLPIVFAFVLGLSFVLLAVAFRSIVMPLVAILLNLLSVSAAYGLLLLVFVEGIGNELLGFTQVEVIAAWLPLFLFSVLFGLDGLHGLPAQPDP